MSSIPGNKPPKRNHVIDLMFMMMIFFNLSPVAERCGQGVMICLPYMHLSVHPFVMLNFLDKS